jgi:uracil-DNA glycosylase family 4
MTEYSEKDQAILEVFKQWQDCTKCELGKQREKKRIDSGGYSGKMVFGDGDTGADMVIIGIGPGENEDIDGAPFTGESGNILDEYLEAVRMLRKELFIMNIVACRPFSKVLDFKTKREREENRDPTQAERDACRPLWQEVLYHIDPLLVVAMGKPAVMEVTGKRSIGMRSANGYIDRCTIPGRITPITYPVMSMYHPAYLSRSGDTFHGGPWHQALIAWKRAVYYLDQLRNLYRGTPMPDRGFKEEEMFIIRGGIT